MITDNHISPDALLMVRNVVNQLHPLNDFDFNQLTKVLKHKKYNKGDIILPEGKICRYLWFICKGSFRIFSIENGIEKNVSFYFENNLASDFISLRHRIPSNFCIMAMEDSEVLTAYKPEYHPLLTFSKSIVQLTANFFQQNFFDEIEHSNTFKLLNPEERYKHLLEHHPKYLSRIPVTHLASYLGMSRKTLNRIRSNVH